MRQLFLFVPLLLIVCFSTACEGGRSSQHCKHTYYFKIGNLTDKEIKISNNFTINDAQIIILTSKHQSEIIYTTHGVGDCDGGVGSDLFQGYTVPIIPVSGEKRFEMIIGDRIISDDIWLRNNWLFASGYSGESTYTLIITDELLNSLPSVEPE